MIMMKDCFILKNVLQFFIYFLSYTKIISDYSNNNFVRLFLLSLINNPFWNKNKSESVGYINR